MQAYLGFSCLSHQLTLITIKISIPCNISWSFLNFNNFYYLFLAMLDLHCCAGFSLVCGESESHSVFPRLYSPWNSPDQNTGVGSLSLLQGIFPTQELNPGLLHCRRILYQLSHKGSPRTLEWVAAGVQPQQDPGVPSGWRPRRKDSKAENRAWSSLINTESQ